MRGGRYPLLIVMAVLLFAVTSCSSEEKSATFTAMDTVMSISVWDAADADGCIAEAKRIVSDLEKELSVTDTESALFRANAGERVTLSENAAGLVQMSLDACARTGGALDVTVYPLVRLWGFTTDEYRIPEQGEIDKLLPCVGYGRLSIGEDGVFCLPEGMMADFGAVAKGYASDLICRMLTERGAGGATVNLGGNVRTVGEKADGSAWRIGIASPDGNGNVCVVKTGAGAVVTSGVYERYFEKDGRHYCHIIDPATGYPVDGRILSVTVIGESGFECDALSTALFVMGFDGAVSYWRQNGGFGMILVCGDGVFVTGDVAESVELVGFGYGERLNVIK